MTFDKIITFLGECVNEQKWVIYMQRVGFRSTETKLAFGFEQRMTLANGKYSMQLINAEIDEWELI